MKKSIFPLLFTAIFSVASLVSVVAQEVAEEKQGNAAAEATKELLDSLNMETVLEQSIEVSIDAQMGQFAEMGVPAEGVKELKGAMMEFMQEVMAYEDLEEELIKIYSEAFTAEELKELTAFYQTPTGQKTLELMPSLMAQGMELGQAKVQARMSELEERITPIFEKYPPQQ